VLALDSNFQAVYETLADSYLGKGLYEEAVATLQKSLILEGASEEEVVGLADAYATSGEMGYWQWQLDYVKERAKQAYVRPIAFAEFYAQLGEKDQAFEWLEKAYQERDGGLVFLNVRQEWDPLRDDPRFQDLLRRMNLQP